MLFRLLTYLVSLSSPALLFLLFAFLFALSVSRLSALLFHLLAFLFGLVMQSLVSLLCCFFDCQFPFAFPAVALGITVVGRVLHTTWGSLRLGRRRPPIVKIRCTISLVPSAIFCVSLRALSEK